MRPSSVSPRPASPATSRRRGGRPGRRGIALFLAVLLTITAGAIAVSATYLGGTTTLVAKQYEREADFKYAADYALQVGKSVLLKQPTLVPNTGFVTLLANSSVPTTGGGTIPGVTVSLYAGATGNTTGQAGSFVSLVAVAADRTGARIVRRLELTTERIARFVFFVDDWPNNLSIGGGSVINGPLWANTQIRITGNGSVFNDSVGSGGPITGTAGNTFRRGFTEYAQRITMPTTAAFTPVPPAASAAGLTFTSNTTGAIAGALLRLEFVSQDMRVPANGTITDAAEGFMRAYRGNANQEAWVRGNYRSENCGDWHVSRAGGPPTFFPHAVHNTTWMRQILRDFNGMNTAQANSHANLNLGNLVQGAPNPRCFPGGRPFLAAVARAGNAAYPLARQQIGGEDSTFTPTDSRGAWIASPVARPATLVARRPWDQAYLTGLSATTNSGFTGAINVDGTVLLSGRFNGSATVYASGQVGFIADLRYANDPALNTCNDMLGVVAVNDLVLADNGINTPQGTGSNSKVLDETPDLYLDAITMSLNGRQVDENPGANNTRVCNTNSSTTGCLYQTGGLIAKLGGAMGAQAGGGFTAQRAFDRCLLTNSPPYFPTTGRLVDNRFIEVDPVGFNVATYFNSLRRN